MAQNTIGKAVDQGVQKVQDILRNRLIVAILLLIQGISFVINPAKAMEGLAKSVAMSLIIASAGILIGYITTRKLSRSNARSVVIAVFFLVLGIIVHIVPDFFSSVFQYAVGITVLLNGIVTLSDNLHINKLITKISAFGHSLVNNEADETMEELKTAYGNAMTEQSDKLMTSVNLLAKKVKPKKYGSVFVSGVFILLGIAMLFFHSQVDDAMARVSGVIMILSALYDFYIALRSYLLQRKIRALNKENA